MHVCCVAVGKCAPVGRCIARAAAASPLVVRKIGLGYTAGARWNEAGAGVASCGALCYHRSQPMLRCSGVAGRGLFADAGARSG